MAKVFKYGLVFFILVAFITNHQDEMFKAILDSPNQVFDLIKILVLSACLWNGFLNIIKASGLIKQLSFLLKPILKLIYVQERRSPTERKETGQSISIFR